jgi:hypothetical protein
MVITQLNLAIYHSPFQHWFKLPALFTLS